MPTAYFTIRDQIQSCIDIKGQYNKFCLPIPEDCTPTSPDGILANCDDKWNCNLCATDQEYFIPYIKGDKIMIQTQFLDRTNADPENPTLGWNDWVHAELWGPDGIVTTSISDFASRWLVGHDGNKSYQMIEINTNQGYFNTGLSCFSLKIIAGEKSTVDNIRILGGDLYRDDAVFDFDPANINSIYDYFQVGDEIQLFFDNQVVVGTVVVDEQGVSPYRLQVSGVPSFAVSIIEYAIVTSTGYLNVTDEICTQDFAKVHECKEDLTMQIRGYYDKYDCFGNYYGLPVASVGNDVFAYDNTIRYWADLRNTSGNLRKEIFAGKARRIATQDIYTFSLAEEPIPPYAHRMLLKMYLAAQRTEINGKEYQINEFTVRNKIDNNNMLLYDAELYTQCFIGSDTC